MAIGSACEVPDWGLIKGSGGAPRALEVAGALCAVSTAGVVRFPISKSVDALAVLLGSCACDISA